ncbi:MAG TPA: hypothetical protein VHY22_09105, partial [Chthoniobacteraceae bacterium]|nr:hypothetical protein [Chthoniobacteraceae bacterium]
TSNSISGDAALTHQLYQSLTSTLQIQGLDYTTTDNVPQSLGASGNSTSQDEQIAGGIIEQYSKVITPKVHLSLGGSALYGYTNQRDTGGSVIQTNESHSFGSVTDSFFLNLPNVDESSIVVTDSAHTLPGYQDGIDYTVSQNGSLTLIRRTSTSTIPLNSKIYFTYTAAAAASGGYETFTGAANFRLDFYSGLLAVYARLNTVENFGAPQTSGVNDANPADFLLSGAEDLSDYTAGIDSSWHWVRLAAEYDVYDSNFGSSRTLRLDQNFTFRPDRNSGLDFDFSEGRSTYQGSSADESDYSAICSYRRSFSGNFGFDIKAGIELQRGDQSVDETLISVQPSLNYSIGDLTIKASYSFEYLKSDSSNQTEEQMLTISMQRTF